MQTSVRRASDRRRAEQPQIRQALIALAVLAGGCVTTAPQPQQPQQPPPTAVCRDGSYSYSAHRSGTCSYHGGVAQWLVELPP
jgi:hypothetical protein